jgi:hypothetical protein
MSNNDEDEETIPKANFLAQLKKLDCSQASIEQVSFWCQFHAKKAPFLAPVWERSLLQSTTTTTPNRMLAHLYLASDVIQNSRKKNKGEESWTKSWKGMMEGCVKHVWETCKDDAKIRRSVKRMMDVWEERKVLGSKARPKQWIPVLEGEKEGEKEEEGNAAEHRRKSSATTTTTKRKEVDGAAADGKRKSKKQKDEAPPFPLRQSHDMKELKENYLEGENALLAEALHEMEKCEREVAETEKVYEEDAPTSLLVHLDSGDANEPMEKLYKTPPEQLSALQKCESATAKRRAAIEKMLKAEATLTKRLAVLNETREVRIKENKRREEWLSHSPGYAVKISTARMKASKRNAAFLATGGETCAKNDAKEDADADVDADALRDQKEFEIPEPVDMDDERKSDDISDQDQDEEYEP